MYDYTLVVELQALRRKISPVEFEALLGPDVISQVLMVALVGGWL